MCFTCGELYYLFCVDFAPMCFTCGELYYLFCVDYACVQSCILKTYIVMVTVQCTTTVP